jgi:hypothetical protein
MLDIPPYFLSRMVAVVHWVEAAENGLYLCYWKVGSEMLQKSLTVESGIL